MKLLNAPIPRRFQDPQARKINFHGINANAFLVFTDVRHQIENDASLTMADFFKYPNICVRLTETESFELQDDEIIYQDPDSSALSLLIPGDMEQFVKHTDGLSEYSAYKLLYLASTFRLNMEESYDLEMELLKLYATQKGFQVHPELLDLNSFSQFLEKTVYQYKGEVGIDGFCISRRYVYFFRIKAVSRTRKNDFNSLLSNIKNKFFKGYKKVLEKIPDGTKRSIKFVLLANVVDSEQILDLGDIEVEMVIGDAFSSLLGRLTVSPLLWNLGN